MSSTFLNKSDYFHYANLQGKSRSKFDLSRNIKGTMNCGSIYPVGKPIWVNPGDTIEQELNYLVRLQTPITPIMDSIYFETAAFFVPTRQVWDHINEFCGENTESSWKPTTKYQIPSVDIGNGVKPKTLLDYFALPILPDSTGRGTASNKVDVLPCRAYAHIWNEFFRDQNVQNPIHIDTGDASYNYSYNTDLTTRGGPLLPVNKYHDYFTSLSIEPQKGPDVPLSLGIPGFVYAGDDQNIQDIKDKYGLHSLHLGHESSFSSSSNKQVYLHPLDTEDENIGALNHYSDVSGGSTTAGYIAAPTNLYADTSNQINVNTLRLALATQRFYELQTHGSRYTEVIKNFFGVTSDDLRLQRPEMLSYSKNAINIHQIVQSSESNTTPIGTTGAMSLTVGTDGRFTKSFTEHGYIITLMWVRYDHSYSQGLNKFWTKLNTFDYYWPTFSNIGYQPIYTKELYLKSNSSDVFGYNEAWIEYRMEPDVVVGEMRPDYPQSLAMWHLGDYYTSTPVYNHDWIKEDKNTLDRCLQVSSSVSDQILFDIYIKGARTSVMPLYSTPSSLGM